MSVFNQKGGVGKTSITCNLAATFAKEGAKVLVLDLDSQGNSSQYLLGDDLAKVTKNISTFFEGTLSFLSNHIELDEIVQETYFKNLSVITSDLQLHELQNRLESRYKISKLRAALMDLSQTRSFDFVFIDTPPALNFFSMSALIASDEVLIPFDCDSFSASGIKYVLNTVKEIATDHQPHLQIGGIIVNQFVNQAKLPLEAIGAIRDLGVRVFEPYLSSSIVMRESHSVSTPLPFYKPRHKLTQQFKKLSDQILQTLEPNSDKAYSRSLNLEQSNLSS